MTTTRNIIPSGMRYVSLVYFSHMCELTSLKGFRSCDLLYLQVKRNLVMVCKWFTLKSLPSLAFSGYMFHLVSSEAPESINMFSAKCFLNPSCFWQYLYSSFSRFFIQSIPQLFLHSISGLRQSSLGTRACFALLNIFLLLARRFFSVSFHQSTLRLATILFTSQPS